MPINFYASMLLSGLALLSNEDVEIFVVLVFFVLVFLIGRKLKFVAKVSEKPSSQSS